MNNKLLFIIPARPEMVPYVYNYINIANDCGRKYDIVCWDRRGEGREMFPNNYFVYYHPTSDRYSSFKKLKEIYGFYRFVRRSIKGDKYAAVFTFTISDSLFFAPWLTRCYKGKYVFDIRDYSPMATSKFTRWLVKRLLRFSAINVISSEGFLRWLPKGFNYTVCHNTDLEKVRQSIGIFERRDGADGRIRILTIGNLRNPDANQMVIDSLANKNDIELRFAGSSAKTGAYLQDYCKENKIENVFFTGRYNKEDEDDIVRNHDMVNIMLPHDKISDYLMSNRFYLSARLRKPMIVNEGSFQAEQVKKYGLGLVISNDCDMYMGIKDYWEKLDWVDYNNRCIQFLKDVCKDLNQFNYAVTTFTKQ